ncbi:NAD(P)H-dependent oxidoreductase [Streptomyces thermolineatus]|uniref:FMN dependent NADH:quinone oxidoreductase n=1 Tax=Streptomyces thermolineatus TaxID=44033 RepID=A0ABN3L271_9ACTN
MARLLHIDSSATPGGSVSREVAATFRKAWDAAHPGSVVTYRDVAAEPVPHLDSDGIASRFVPVERRDAAQRAAAAVQDALVAELVSADAYLFSVPMYNWSVPSTFKAWLDHVIVPGRTTAFGNEPQSVRGRPATVVLATGGAYGPSSSRSDWDFATPYLYKVLRDGLGLETEIVRVELTLAHSNPAMADLRGAADANRLEAHSAVEHRARALAARLAG